VRLLLVFIVISFAKNTFGQLAQIDSLQLLIAGEGETKRKVELLNQLSFNLFGYDIEQAGNTTQSAIVLAQKIDDRKGEGWAKAYRGVYFLFGGNLQEAKFFATNSFQIGQRIQDSNLQAYSLNQLGNVFRDRGVFDSAFYFYRLAGKVPAERFYTSIVHMNKARCFLILNKPDSALTEVNEVIRLRNPINGNKAMPDVWLLLAHCYRQKSDLQKAEVYYGLVLKSSSKSSLNYSAYLSGMGEVYFVRGDFQKALANWTQVLGFHRRLNYRYEVASLLSRMGEAFVTQGYYDLANEYLLRGLDISERASYQYLRGSILHQLTWVNFRTKSYQLALQNSQQAEKIFFKVNTQLALAACWDLRGLIYRQLKKYDSSLFYHNKGLTSRMEIGNKVEISAGLFNKGEFYLLTGQLEQARPFYYKSLAIDESFGDDYGRSLNYNRIGNIYLQQGVLDSAKIYLDKSEALAVPTSAMEVMRDNYRDLAAYMVKVGKPLEAINYYKLNEQLSDSLFNKRTAESLSSYRTLYDVERSENEIELLNKNVQINKEQVQKQRAILIAVLVVVLILAALAISYFRFNRKLKKFNFVLAEKNEEIQVQSEELVEANEVLSKLNREINEQREEIQAQAEELTESNQTISGINQTLEQRIDTRTAELKKAYKELDTFFYRSSHDFRRPLTTFMGLAEVAKITIKDTNALELFDKVNETARNLDKMLMKLQSISDLGVQELLYREVFVKELMKIGLDSFKQELHLKGVMFDIDVDPTLSFYSYPALIKIIFDNLIENAISFRKEVGAHLILRAYQSGDGVIVEFEDNGQGIEEAYLGQVFDMYFRGNEQSKGNGLGLYIVQKTVGKLKGQVSISSKIGIGTKVTIFFPRQVEDVLKT
jgi:signal transduction histidine kinase